MNRQILVALVVSATLALVQSQERPSYIQCLNSIECAATQCCMLSQQKYSIPTCINLGIEGSSCRPDNMAQDFHISYPDGFTAAVTNAFLNLCSCAEGLACSRITHTCEAV